MQIYAIYGYTELNIKKLTNIMKLTKLEKLVLRYECLHVFDTYKETEETEETETLYLECSICHEKRIEETDLQSEDTQIDIIKQGNKPSLEYSNSSNYKRLRKIQN